MRRTHPARLSTSAAGVILVLSALAAHSQMSPRLSALPATPATSLAPTSQVAPLTASPTQVDAATRAHRAEILYASGLLSINASNSSLNSILREISRQTGMKITGGVREERVFGHYGPAAPADILATLLGGTGTNMVLRQTASAAPEELILTPRSGGATPPNPNAPGFDDTPDEQGQDDGRNQAPPPRTFPARQLPQATDTPINTDNPPEMQPANTQPANNVLGDPRNVTPTASQIRTTNSVPTDTLPTPSTTTQTVPGIVDTPNQAPVTPATQSSTDSSTPAAAKTPEQIFQELQQLRQQQQKTPQ